jgi:predicted ATPase
LTNHYQEDIISINATTPIQTQSLARQNKVIESIYLENFRSIEKSSEIKIAPITLLTGPNSSGNSSILKPILVMKQTADSRDIQRSIQIDGDYAELGPFSEYVYNHDGTRNVKFSLSFSSDRELLWRTRKPPKTLAKRRRILSSYLHHIIPSTIRLEVSLGSGAYEETVTKQVKYSFDDELLGSIIVEKTRGPKGAYFGIASLGDESTSFTPLRRSKFYDMSRTPRVYEYVPLSRSELGNNLPKLLTYLTRIFEVNLSNISYLGPLREEPAPLYGASSERPQDVGKSGGDMPSVLWTGRSEKKQEELRRKTEKWMAEFNISNKLELHKLGAFFQILLRDYYSGVKSNLTNVGFGASQLLPVIVAGYYSPNQCLLILDQPEIHLHPKAQATLGDLLIDISRENKKILIETHSEHLLMRIQRRIAERKIDAKEVALYYCKQSSKGTRIKQINISPQGQLDLQLPSGFFDEGYVESKELFEAIAKRNIRNDSAK